MRDGTTEAAVHVEIEREWRPELPRRLFEYASAAVVSTRLPVWSVVVLLRSGGRPPNGTGVYRIPGIDGDAFVFRYHVVPLWRLDARRMRKHLGLAGAPFCAAMRGADESFVRALVDDVHADHSLATHDRESAMQLLYVVSAAILGSDTARRIFHVESIIQDPNVQELIREWEDKGVAKGRAKGLAEGLTEGRALEARSLLHRMLELRSFSVSPELGTRIEREQNISQLRSWLEAAMTATSLDDIFRDR